MGCCERHSAHGITYPMTLQQLAIDLGQELKKRELKIAVAESCTGGGFSYWITSTPGSSDWFERGLVTYSNAAKVELLKVNPITLDTFGAVSEQVAREMAIGALQYSQADIGIAITGIAGPRGGTKDKPVGTVWMAFTNRKQEMQVFVEIFSGNRQSIREQTIEYVFTKLLKWLRKSVVA